MDKLNEAIIAGIKGCKDMEGTSAGAMFAGGLVDFFAVMVEHHPEATVRQVALAITANAAQHWGMKR